jgi:hypothetical protein
MQDSCSVSVRRVAHADDHRPRVERSDRFLTLEGKLREPWRDESRGACLGAAPDGLRLELIALTFIDAAVVDSLAGLICRGAKVIA